LPGRFLAVIILPHQAVAGVDESEIRDMQLTEAVPVASSGYSAECFVGTDP